MVPSLAKPLAISTLLFTAVTLAAPTRTQCRCAIVSDSPSHSDYTPSTAHWLPSSPSPSSAAADLCSNLGPELENFQLTKPDLYDSYIRSSQIPVRGGQSSTVSTFLLLDFTVRNGLQRSSEDETDEPRRTSRPRQRIVCEAGPEPFSEYQSSFLNLWALQLIVVLAIFACVAEGMHLGMRWMDRRSRDHEALTSGRLRLMGAEKRLLAIPASDMVPDCIFSPGAEKKIRAYESARYVPVQWTTSKREFSAYDEEDDDEMNRPVM